MREFMGAKLGGIVCILANRHVYGPKFRRDGLWYQSCQVCGKVVDCTAPNRKVKS